MSIVMRMEMPKSCEGCWVPSNKCKWRKIAWYLKEKPNVGYRDIRNPFCPIICELPEGHGDLVDWNDVEKELEATFADYVDDAPYLDKGQPGFLRRKVYPDALMIRPIKAKIIIPEEGGKENK